MGAETAWFRGEGGAIFEMDLPLPEAIAARVVAGAVRRVAGPDGGEYVPDEADEPTVPVPAPPTKRPADTALKPAWVAWAVAQGADLEAAEAATKQDLIDKYGR